MVINNMNISRIDVDSNDLPWYLNVQQIPTLMLIPAGRLRGQRDTVMYEYENDLDVKNLVKFVLYNSKNPDTLSQFLRDNILNRKHSINEQDLSKNSKLRYDLINLVSSKLRRLENESKYFRDEISKNQSYYSQIRIDKNLFEIDLLKKFLKLKF